MPISSTEIQNILSAQTGMFASSAQYAQAVSAQYGFQGGGPPPVDDPRNAPALQAGMLASGAIRYGTDGAAMAASTAAMFGYAPRVFDPFTATAASATAGYRVAGISGGIGAGAATAGAYMAMGSVFKWGVDQMVAGAQQQGMLNYQMGQLAPNMNTAQLGMMSNMVSQAARSGMGSINDITSMMQSGAADGSLNTQSITQFQQSFQKLITNVRQVAVTLNSSLSEAHQAIQQVKALGVSSDQAGGFLGSMRAIGYTGGLNPQQMYTAAAQGSQFAAATGISRQAGAMGAMVNYGALGMVERGGLIEGVGVESYGRFNQGAMRFLGSAPGQRVLAAMMGPDGELNADVAQQVASGTISRQQINEMARRNLSRRGARDLFGATQNELMGQFVTQYGPQAVMPAVETMAGGFGRPESVKAMLTGMTRDELGQMSSLNSAMPGIRSRMLQEGRDAFQQGSRSMGLGEQIEASIGMMIQPFKDRLRQYGADLTQSAQETIKQVTADFTGRPPSAADPSVYAQYFSRYMSQGANNSVSGQIRAGMAGVGRTSYFHPSLPPAQTFGVGALPVGLRLGAMEGVRPSDLPMFGFAPEEHNEYGGAAALSLLPAFGGRNVYGLAGAGLGALGSSITGAAAGPSYGFMGMGGVGMVRGTAMAAGGALRAAGGLLKFGGAAGAGLSLAALAGDLAFNEIPELERQYGYAPITRGAVMGQSARTLEFMSQQGLLGAPLQQLRVGSQIGGLDYESATARGLTPVGGLIQDREERGKMLFADKDQLARADQVLRGVGDVVGRMQSQGPNVTNIIQNSGMMGQDMNAQVQYLSRNLPGFSRQEIAAFVAARSQTRIEAAALGAVDVEKAAKTMAEQASSVSDEWQELMSAIDPQKAAAQGLPPLYTFLTKLKAGGKHLADPENQTKLAQYIQKLNPKLNATRLALNLASEGGTLSRSTYKELGIEGVANTEKLVPIEMLGQIQMAQAFSRGSDAETALLQEQGTQARNAAGRASAVAGYAGTAFMNFANQYSEGQEFTDAKGVSAKDRGVVNRMEATETLVQRTLSDPTLSSTQILRAADIMERSGTDAGIQGAAALRNAARTKYLTHEKKKTNAVDVLSSLAGAKLDRSQRARALETISKGERAFDSDVQGILTAGVLDRMKAASPDEIPRSEDASKVVDQLRLDAEKFHDGTKEAFAGTAARINTFGTMPTTGSRQGDLSATMQELMGNLKNFNDRMSSLNETLDKFPFIGK